MRITREAVSNAVRHGGAQRIRIRLSYQDGRRQLVVHDDGRGFVPDRLWSESVGYGLISMEERARGLPGSFHIDTHCDAGTTVTVTW